MQRKETKWKYLQECRAKGWLINSNKERLKNHFKVARDTGMCLGDELWSSKFFSCILFHRM